MKAWLKKKSPALLVWIVVSCLLAKLVTPAYATPIYVMSHDGRMYAVDLANPSGVAQLVRTVPIPSGMRKVQFDSLTYTGGYFYTFYDHYLIRFGFVPGDEATLGYFPTLTGNMAVRSDGTVWVAESNSSSLNLRTINLATLTLGATLAPSPWPVSSTNAGYQYPQVLGLGFDSSSRAIVNMDIGSGYLIRINNLSTGVWDKDCNGSTTAQEPCWYTSIAFFRGIATDTSTGITYVNQGRDIRILSLPNTPSATLAQSESFATPFGRPQYLAVPGFGQVVPQGLSFGPAAPTPTPTATYPPPPAPSPTPTPSPTPFSATNYFPIKKGIATEF